VTANLVAGRTRSSLSPHVVVSFGIRHRLNAAAVIRNDHPTLSVGAK
jgi:hypothetical protein